MAYKIGTRTCTTDAQRHSGEEQGHAVQSRQPKRNTDLRPRREEEEDEEEEEEEEEDPSPLDVPNSVSMSPDSMRPEEVSRRGYLASDIPGYPGPCSLAWGPKFGRS